MGEQTMRQALEKSFEESEEEKEGGSGEDAEESLGPTEPKSEDPDETIVVDDVSDKETESGDDKPEPILTDAEKPGDEVDPDPDTKTEEIPAPISWKPATRELWGKLPLDVQKEVQRREADISRGLQQASGHKKMAQEYIDVVKPFESLIRAQNSTPSQAITNLMSTAARLTMGNPAEKARVITEIIQTYAIDVEMLDTALSGAELPDSQFAPILAQIDERLAPMNDFMGQFQQTQQTQAHEASQQVTTDLTAFEADPKNEFFEDVREDMADYMEFAHRRNQPMTLAQAYDKACANHPEVSKVVNQRKAARTARLSDAGGGRKRHAASSVPSSSPASDGKGSKSSTLRGALEGAFEEAEE